MVETQRAQILEEFKSVSTVIIQENDDDDSSNKAIIEFYNNYKKRCLSFYNNDTAYSKFFDPKNKKMNERIVPIIEAIINDENIEESAVNIPNQNFIDSLPDDIVVEVPCTINKKDDH